MIKLGYTEVNSVYNSKDSTLAETDVCGSCLS